MTRTAAFDLLRGRTRRDPFDLVIVGGGATGLGAAVDAASRGHSVCLVERGDFAQGTSSRSTKLIHGGVRYLRQGNLSLVIEALRERGRLLRNAPHLVSSLPFVIPIYRWWEGPFYGVGLQVYDRLAGELGLERSRWIGRKETLRHLPTLAPDGLLGGVTYQDGQFDDARLAIALARTAADHGAVVLNHVACLGLHKESDRVTGIHARDAETGEAFEIAARAVLNATGVFVDRLRREDEPAAPDLVTASQGIHLVLPRAFLPGDAALMVPRTDDGRVLFAIPWQDRVIVGTTDTPVEATDEPVALAGEIRFLLEHASRYLTGSPGPDDVLGLYAGLRPLVRQSGVSRTASLSRDHTVLVSQSGLVTVTGGKWTTYRKMAADAVDRAETVAGLPPRPCRTETLALHGATSEAFPEAEAPLRVYGSDAPAIRALGRPAPIHPRLPYRQGEVIWHVREEMARTVEDVLSRRTRALILDARAAVQAAPLVAALLAGELGRDSDWQRAQVEAFRKLARNYLPPSSESGNLELETRPGIP